MEHTISALIILIFIGISYVFCVNRRAVCWQIVDWGSIPKPVPEATTTLGLFVLGALGVSSGMKRFKAF